MNLHFSHYRIVPLAFVVLSIGSATYLSISTVNDLSFFPALQQTQVAIESLAYHYFANATSWLNVTASVYNPSTYTGLTLDYIFTQVSFNANGESFNNASLVSQPLSVNTAIGPGVNISRTIAMSIGSQEALSLESFVASHGGSITAHVFVQAEITTFLEPMIGRFEPNRQRDFAFP